MVALEIDRLPQVRGDDGLADIQQGIAHLLDIVGDEYCADQLFGFLFVLECADVALEQLFVVTVEFAFGLANLERQTGVVCLDRRLNHVDGKPYTLQHRAIGLGLQALEVGQILHLLDAVAAEFRNALEVGRDELDAAQGQGVGSALFAAPELLQAAVVDAPLQVVGIPATIKDAPYLMSARSGRHGENRSVRPR